MTSDCMITKRSLDSWGYGLIWIGDTCWKENRWVFYQTHGYLPEVVMHTCDRPACINPEHLVAGTFKTNAVDRMNKGRNGRLDGQRNGRAKVTDEEADQIRTRYAAGGINQTDLGSMYGLSQTQVSKIVRKDCFKGSTKNSNWSNK